jgi:serine O-acetyltransferase
MRLNDWLAHNEVEEALIRINHESLHAHEALGFATRTQVIDILKLLRSLILPGVYEKEPVSHARLDKIIRDKMNSAARSLCAIISQLLSRSCSDASLSADECCERAEQLTIRIMEGLPDVRKTLSTDIRAAYEGDPAAKSLEEIMLSYPSLEAVSIYRIAHLIYTCDVPLIPRIMTEYAHRNTGIDIHPGATIGESFFIDHGTGVVIGETCTIGNGVKLYQGVTLGAKSFPLDENGNPIKGIKRHPDIEDNVVIYAGATILGGDTRIGHDSVIGGNVWLTQSVPPYSTVFNAQPSPYIKPMEP